jgi:hypothetical protein
MRISRCHATTNATDGAQPRLGAPNRIATAVPQLGNGLAAGIDEE